MRNSEVARLLYDISELLELSGENIFKIRAYSRAARTIEGITEDIEKIAKYQRLEEIPGVHSWEKTGLPYRFSDFEGALVKFGIYQRRKRLEEHTLAR